MKEIPSRREPDLKATTPFLRVRLDWQDLSEKARGYKRVLTISCEASHWATVYFCVTAGREDENLRILKDYMGWVKSHFGLRVKFIRGDMELAHNSSVRWLRSEGILVEPSAPYTHAQNGGAERSGGMVMEKARAMRIGSKLPHNLWKKPVSCAAYLYNRTPTAALKWKTPYEAVYTHMAEKDGITGPRTPQLAHLKAYGCRCYALKLNPNHKPSKLQKLDPRAYIGYLVGYNSTNIYRVWVPELGKVIATRDVIFNEMEFFSRKDALERSEEMIRNLEDLVAKVQLPEELAVNEAILEDDSEMEVIGDEDETNASSNEQQSEEENVQDEIIVGYRTDLEEVGWDDFPKPSKPTEGTPYADYVGLTVRQPDQQVEDVEEALRCKDELRVLQEEERFYSFRNYKIASSWMEAFAAGRRFSLHRRDLAEPPRNVRELENHPIKQQFRAAQEAHLREHDSFRSWEEVTAKSATGHQVLHCKWVFTYKFDKHGMLQKCKARLVFDLELTQLDAINAFVHSDLDEEVFMKMPPGFTKEGKILRLKKALYGLRRLPLLWQKTLTDAFRDLGFKEVPQEPCVMMKGDILVFFFVDDIVLGYRKKKEKEVRETITDLKKRFKISELGELKWFLGIHVLRRRIDRSIWLSQKSYIEKVAAQYQIDTSGRVPRTPMDHHELLPFEGKATNKQRELYQKKVGSILFAAISTRPNVAFAASRLSRFNHNPSDVHHEAADRVIRYLYHTRGLSIRYGGNGDAQAMVCDAHERFVKLLRMEEITQWLESIKKEDELRERIMASQMEREVTQEFLTGSDLDRLRKGLSH
ncbi:hypothetical protein DL768_011035 [Monosporascus sp. mg162]|nr:hypothetical protein DL768_011035 [Monosporascus sp. mg162]